MTQQAQAGVGFWLPRAAGQELGRAKGYHLTYLTISRDSI